MATIAWPQYQRCARMKWLGPALLYVGLPLLLAEVTEVAPWIAARLLKSATRILPPEYRERYRLEWLGELDAVPGKLLKLLFAIRIGLRVPATRRELKHAEPTWVRLGRSLLVAVITCALAVARLASHVLGRLSARPTKPLVDLTVALNDQPNVWVGVRGGLVPFDTPIEELDLSVGTYNSLKRGGVLTLADLLTMDDPSRQLLKIRNFGRASLEELQEKLGEIGLDHMSWE